MDYKKVIEDFNNGTLDKKIVTIVVDNDDVFFNVNSGDESWDEKQEQLLNKEYGRGQGYWDILEILKAAGVNAEWC